MSEPFEGSAVFASAKPTKWVTLKEQASGDINIQVGVDSATLTPDEAERLAKALMKHVRRQRAFRAS